MIFLLDENFPKSATAFLRSLSHEVYDLRDLGLAGSADDIVVHKALELGAVILSTDRDFFHTLGHQYPTHLGVIVIALKTPGRTAILSRLEWFLNHVATEQWAGRAFQLRDSTWLAKPPIR
ncbi:MAG: DUF5615 family PIN-like protein [Verrucomicrobiota bacterium]